MTISVKLAKPIGRHYGKRLYKAGVIYHVDQTEGEYLLAYKDLDGVNRFKQMIPKAKVAAPQAEVAKPKRKRGRPKKSPKIEDVVDEQPVVEANDADLVDADFVEKEVEEVQETETFDPNEDNQEYSHEV